MVAKNLATSIRESWANSTIIPKQRIVRGCWGFSLPCSSPPFKVTSAETEKLNHANPQKNLRLSFSTWGAVSWKALPIFRNCQLWISKQTCQGHCRRMIEGNWKSNFRQFAELKSRVEMSSQQKADQHACRVSRKKINAHAGKSQSKAGTRARNIRDVANRCVFSMIRGSWCSKSSLAKAAGAEVPVLADRWKMARRCGAKHTKPHCGTDFWSSDVEKLQAAVARRIFVSQNVENTAGSDHFLNFRCSNMARRCGAKQIFIHFQFKMHKTPQSRTNFWRSDVQKWHAAVARSTFASQNVQDTSVWDPFCPFWTFWCSKIARPCGEKHIGKSQCEKTEGYGPLFEDEMSKNCSPLWREAHLKVKMYKTHAFCSILKGF